MLEDAGDRGVCSTEFYDAFLPRFPARIHELKKLGYLIEDEFEGKFKRWFLRRSANRGGPGNSGRVDECSPVEPSNDLRMAKPAISLAGTRVEGVSRDTGRAGGQLLSSPAPSTVGSSSSGERSSFVHPGSESVAARSDRSYYEMEALFDGEGAA